MITEEERADLLRLEMNASPGGWQAESHIRWSSHEAMDIWDYDGNCIAENVRPRDAAFIAACRNAVPLLLEEVFTLTSAHNEVVGVCADAGVHHPKRMLAEITKLRTRVSELEGCRPGDPWIEQTLAMCRSGAWNDKYGNISVDARELMHVLVEVSVARAIVENIDKVRAGSWWQAFGAAWTAIGWTAQAERAGAT